VDDPIEILQDIDMAIRELPESLAMTLMPLLPQKVSAAEMTSAATPLRADQMLPPALPAPSATAGPEPPPAATTAPVMMPERIQPPTVAPEVTPPERFGPQPVPQSALPASLPAPAAAAVSPVAPLPAAAALPQAMPTEPVNATPVGPSAAFGPGITPRPEGGEHLEGGELGGSSSLNRLEEKIGTLSEAMQALTAALGQNSRDSRTGAAPSTGLGNYQPPPRRAPQAAPSSLISGMFGR
jgi:hypothetical protein